MTANRRLADTLFCGSDYGHSVTEITSVQREQHCANRDFRAWDCSEPVSCRSAARPSSTPTISTLVSVVWAAVEVVISTLLFILVRLLFCTSGAGLPAFLPGLYRVSPSLLRLCPSTTISHTDRIAAWLMPRFCRRSCRGRRCRASWMTSALSP